MDENWNGPILNMEESTLCDSAVKELCTDYRLKVYLPKQTQ